MDQRWIEAKENDRKYNLHSWSVQGKIAPRLIVGGEGIWFWDEAGNRFMDFGSQLVNLNIGHQHPKVLEAIKKQCDEMAFIAPQFNCAVRGELAKKIVGLLPESFGKCFFTVGGADANENAVKMARAYTGRHKIIARYRSYHGATYGAISLTGDPRRAPVEPAMPGVVHVFDPYCYRCTFGQKPGACGMECAKHIEETILFENPGTVAAIIMESVTGSNGIFPPPPGYMEAVEAICRKYGILLICDEVMTGFGRTGKMFGFQNFAITPDIVTMAKGVNSGYVPLGVCAVSQKIADWYEDKMLWCGLTYSGHPISCAAALGCIQAYEEEGLIDNAARMGMVLAEELDKIKAKHPCVGDVRSIGLFGCIELVRDKASREALSPWNGAPTPEAAAIVKALGENGVSMFVRWNFMFVTPPIIITEAELREGMARISRSLDAADAMLAKGGAA